MFSTPPDKQLSINLRTWEAEMSINILLGISIKHKSARYAHILSILTANLIGTQGKTISENDS